MRVKNDFYKMRAPEMAKALLGKLLCRRVDGKVIKLRITETEAYFGEDDTACHASRGKTERTKTMYQEGGVAYIYLCYGIHNMLNIVSGEKDFPEACLIRGVEGYDGPGKLTKAMKIDRSLNGADMRTSEELWLEDDGCSPVFEAGKRIGIGYASQEDQNRLWRFTLIYL
ncbi:putative 3-methyladenine DNA glycosylase [Andreesenia angusta]|uniref:Putative 3-methyladenine DNA glycosylase n=1 Tax=Andreesenia angusta TaxID=39480 RepID=A0A1S1V5X7_9FIRM|nr:DNA-3-methyladenine glycosylase [Andreesenia angusta]OHW62023.1 putative 3-methyladenine DNA glycosylase [Andreesenia angusta]